MLVYLGNSNPQMTVSEDVLGADGIVRTVTRQVEAEHLNQSVTTVDLWEGIDDDEVVEGALATRNTDNDRLLHAKAQFLGKKHRSYAIAVHEVEHLLAVHSAGAAPDWVSCPDDPELQAALASYFGCPEGEPVMLLTNDGRDALHAQMLSTSTQPASLNYVAISTDAGSGFAASDTTLVSELSSNGLGRAQATYAHTSGTNTSTLTHTWTYSTTGSVAIKSWANFNAASSGTMGWEAALSTTVTVATSGDTATITFTLTAG